MTVQYGSVPTTVAATPTPEPAPRTHGDAIGFRVMLMGQSGTGKTYSLRSLVEAGLEVFVISTEPGITSVLGDLPEDKVHWKYIAPAVVSWDIMLSNAQMINTLTFKALSATKEIDRKNYGQFLEVVSSCAGFVDDRTGKNFGMVDAWGTDRVLVLDTLSGLSKMSMDLVVGAKPVKGIESYGVAMDNLERLVDRWTCGIPCHFVMNTHLEREKDEVTGAIKNMPSTLGNKLAPKLPINFDDVIMAKRMGAEWVWSTADLQTELKSRHVEVSDKLKPDYGQILRKWQEMGGVITHTPILPQPGA